jgi:hypothetical protein
MTSSGVEPATFRFVAQHLIEGRVLCCKNASTAVNKMIFVYKSDHKRISGLINETAKIADNRSCKDLGISYLSVAF